MSSWDRLDVEPPFKNAMRTFVGGASLNKPSIVDGRLGNVLPVILQKLVGEIFYFWEGNFAGNLVGILRDFFGPAK